MIATNNSKFRYFLMGFNQPFQPARRNQGVVVNLADQLARASTSIVLNIAEGSGKYSGPDKRRYYLSAAGSTAECAAILDILMRFNLVEKTQHSLGKELLDRMAAMLVGLAKRHQREQRPQIGA